VLCDNAHLREVRLEREGFRSVHQQMPGEHAWVGYDLLFMGQRITGQRRPSPLSLEADHALDPIQAALLLGRGRVSSRSTGALRTMPRRLHPLRTIAGSE